MPQRTMAEMNASVENLGKKNTQVEYFSVCVDEYKYCHKRTHNGTVCAIEYSSLFQNECQIRDVFQRFLSTFLCVLFVFCFFFRLRRSYKQRPTYESKLK